MISLYLAIFTYVATISLLLLLILAYLRGFEGLWPPRSRTKLALGWAWYASIYLAAIWLSFLESSLPLKGLIWKGVGLILIMDGGLILIWAFWAFRSARRVIGARLDTLISSGPYRYVRNPQYVGSVMALLGITLLQGSLHLLAFTIMQAVIFHVLALLEERELEKRFGEKYLEYKRKTPRYLPFRKAIYR